MRRGADTGSSDQGLSGSEEDDSSEDGSSDDSSDDGSSDDGSSDDDSSEGFDLEDLSVRLRPPTPPRPIPGGASDLRTPVPFSRQLESRSSFPLPGHLAKGERSSRPRDGLAGERDP